eukprot:549578-Pelagomonas_calceolata.AAC.1
MTCVGKVGWVGLGDCQYIKVHLNSRSCSSLPTFMYGNVDPPPKDQFKYLGMPVDKHMKSA